MTTNNPNTEVLAWTKNDGVTPPPKGVRPSILGGTAFGMSGIWIGLLAVDTLCPEHRAWIEVFAIAALVASAIAIVGLLRQRSWSAMFAMASAIFGINIGALEATHDPTLGLLVMAGFAILAGFFAMAMFRQYQSAKWSRRAAAELSPIPAGTVDSAINPTVDANNSESDELIKSVDDAASV